MQASRSRTLSMETNVVPKGTETRLPVDRPREVQSRNEASFSPRGSPESLAKVDENGRWSFRVTRVRGLVVCVRGKCCGCSGLAIGLGFFRTPGVRVMRLAAVAARISCVMLRCWWIEFNGGLGAGLRGRGLVLISNSDRSFCLLLLLPFSCFDRTANLIDKVPRR